jgi:hypothetical protein
MEARLRRRLTNAHSQPFEVEMANKTRFFVGMVQRPPTFGSSAACSILLHANPGFWD